MKFRWKPMAALIILGFCIHYFTYALPVNSWPEVFLGKENQIWRFILAIPAPLLVWAVSPFVFSLFRNSGSIST